MDWLPPSMLYPSRGPLSPTHTASLSLSLSLARHHTAAPVNSVRLCVGVCWAKDKKDSEKVGTIFLSTVRAAFVFFPWVFTFQGVYLFKVFIFPVLASCNSSSRHLTPRLNCPTRILLVVCTPVILLLEYGTLYPQPPLQQLLPQFNCHSDFERRD
jgi:hypothetical protein